MAKGDEEIDVVANILATPILKWTFYDKLDLVTLAS